MIIGRVVRGITDHFPARASEWALASMLMLWGNILLSSPGIFQSSTALRELAGFATEAQWGFACLLMGGVRLTALFVNGSFPRFRYSPHIRAVMSYFSCYFWFSISFGILLSQIPTTDLAVYPVLLLLDVYNGHRAACDARDADEVARNAPYY